MQCLVNNLSCFKLNHLLNVFNTLHNVKQREKWPEKRFSLFTVECFISISMKHLMRHENKKFCMSGAVRRGGGVSKVSGQIPPNSEIDFFFFFYI